MHLEQVAAYHDDHSRAEELKLEVGVIRNSHKFCVARSAQDGLISAREVDYLKVESLRTKVCSSSECDGQGDPPEGVILTF